MSSRFATVRNEYLARFVSAIVLVCAAMAEWSKAPGCNPGSARAGIAGPNPARRTIPLLTASTVSTALAAIMVTLVVILLP